jgi:carboxylesterase type B
VPELGSFHAAEFPFIFNRSMPLVTIQPGERPLVDLMQGHWTRFANTGTPNHDASVFWPKYTPWSPLNLDIHLPPSVTEAHRKAECDFWDGLVDALPDRRPKRGAKPLLAPASGCAGRQPRSNLNDTRTRAR